MDDKKQLIAMLKEELNRWETLLNSLSDEQAATPLAPSEWSTKDFVAHVMAWQQLSIARLNAAGLNQAPEYPAWTGGINPDVEDNHNQTNDRIYKIYHPQSWAKVHGDWKAGFQHFIELADATPEKDLLEVGKYSWIAGYALSAVLRGSYNHHHEHFESLAEWWKRHNSTQNADYHVDS